MLLFIGELLSVETGDYKSLVFRSTRYDIGLKENVPCSISIAISDETEQFIDNYKQYVGEKIVVGVSAILTKKKDKVFYLTQTDVLDIASLLL